MEVSPAGAVGAAIGLAIGFVDYKLVSGYLERRLRATDTSKTRAEKDAYEAKIGHLKRILFITTVGFFPIAGYFFGATIGG